MRKKKDKPKPRNKYIDACLHCRIPESKCKGNCTKKQQIANGGKQNES